MTYEEAVAAHRWNVPERYNIAADVCDKHPRDKLAMVWEDWRGTERNVTFGELQDLSNRFANVLEAHGIERTRPHEAKCRDAHVLHCPHRGGDVHGVLGLVQDHGDAGEARLAHAER